jgi:hypothetical protein
MTTYYVCLWVYRAQLGKHLSSHKCSEQTLHKYYAQCTISVSLTGSKTIKQEYLCSEYIYQFSHIMHEMPNCSLNSKVLQMRVI